MKSQHTDKMKRAALGVFCVGLAFVAWGTISSISGASISKVSGVMRAKTSKSANDREAVLNEAKFSSKTASDGNTNVLMNDPFIAKQRWGQELTATPQAHEITRGSKDIIIAVIDTGIDVNHPGLKESLWENPGENGVVTSDFCAKQSKPLAVKECNKATNGIDDDGNGYIDDVHGWNFVHNDSSLTDNHGHGSHIAGIIGANPEGAGKGVMGVSPKVSIMALKYFDPKSPNTNNLKNTIQAIRYAVKMKANIINYSGGGTDYSAEELAAVKEAEKAGILFVAAAGNERSNSDEAGKHYYPADYDVTNVISVTAVNSPEKNKAGKEEPKVLASSNFGVRTVDIAAPGENIYSTMPNGSYGVMTGTSQATAFVTGVAALLLSANREFSASELKKYILKTGDEYVTLMSKTGTAKLLNSYRALTSLDLGVSASGVTASNTRNMNPRAFAADKGTKDVKFNVSSPGANGEEAAEPAESIAMFGRDLVKAIHNAPGKQVGPASETKR